MYWLMVCVRCPTKRPVELKKSTIVTDIYRLFIRGRNRYSSRNLLVGKDVYTQALLNSLYHRKGTLR